MTDFRWAVAAAYVAVAVLAFVAGRKSTDRERWFWTAAAATLLLMGIGKQFQLQDDLAEAARILLKQLGWYEWHELAQGLLAGLAALAALGFATFLFRRLPSSSARVKAAGATLSLLLAFVLVRAASLHAMDAWVTREALGLRLGWWVELAALAALGAFTRL